ncbi:MAG: methionyl-tRNA formyltransferase [Candidatus Paceibacterota bacterium]|jgi:methionyl-tRNA formyltransferase
MTKKSKTIVFFGNERLVSGLRVANTFVLDELIKADYKVAAVVSHHKDSKSRTNRPLEIAQTAKVNGIPVFLPQKPVEILDDLIAFQAEVAILVAYGRIIPQKIIDIFPRGIVNLHPSLLPKYRGATPIESVILNGESVTGVSIMQLTAGMDEGPIYAQATIDLKDTETKFDIYNRLARTGASLLLKILPSILDGSLQPAPQDNSKATYCKPLTKQDSILKPNEVTATQAERMVRAYLSFPKTKINILGEDIIITKSHVVSKLETPIDILCQDHAYLVIDELIAPSGKTMNAAAFLRGYKAN